MGLVNMCFRSLKKSFSLPVERTNRFESLYAELRALVAAVNCSATLFSSVDVLLEAISSLNYLRQRVCKALKTGGDLCFIESLGSPDTVLKDDGSPSSTQLSQNLTSEI